jgi:ketosteroid isomerase-like protein
MRNTLKARWLFSVATVLACVAASAAQASDAGEKAVGEATAQFYSALNAMFTGDVGPMKDVWSHAADVTYMGPGGGFQVGWNQVLAIWEKQAAMKLGGTVKPEGMRMTVGRDIAIASTYEEGENTNADGKPAKVSIRATNLFRKENGKWKMIGHHTDLLPYLAK